MVETDLIEMRNLILQSSVRNITEFGRGKLQLPVPYVVIQDEQGANNGIRTFNLRAHFPIGQNQALEQYLLEELPRIIATKRDMCGAAYFKPTGNYSAPSVDTGDNTLVAAISYTSTLIVPR